MTEIFDADRDQPAPKDSEPADSAPPVGPSAAIPEEADAGLVTREAPEREAAVFEPSREPDQRVEQGSRGGRAGRSRRRAPRGESAAGRDARHMRRALELALRGRGRVEPNPLVGAVIVSGDRVLGEGWHGQYGGPHAEAHAIRQAGDDAHGATLYVTLEPCAHEGKTPACVDAILDAGVERVVYALTDPNPKARGGAEVLQDAGVTVEGGLLEAHARLQNMAFVKRVMRGLPAVRLKWAMTLDGKIASRSGDSRWISGEESRRHAHRGRARADAVIIGIETALTDDPALTVRLDEEAVRGATGRPPLRVVVDSQARLPLESKLLAKIDQGPVLVAVSEAAPEDAVAALEEAGAEVLRLAKVSYGETEGLDVEALLRALAGRGGEEPDPELQDDPSVPWPASRVLVEGGGRLHASFIAAGLVDEVTAYLAPRLLGGRDAVTPVEGSGVSAIADAIDLSSMRVRRMGADLVIEGRIGHELPKRDEALGEGLAPSTAPSSTQPRPGIAWSGPRLRPVGDDSEHAGDDAQPAVGAFQDRDLECVSCGGTFAHTAEAQAYYHERGFTSEPKRCPDCRRQRRSKRERERGGEDDARGNRERRPSDRGRGSRDRDRGGRGSGRRSAPSTMFDIVCASCGSATQVPFKPDPDRPVYCRDCYQERGGRGRRG